MIHYRHRQLDLEEKKGGLAWGQKYLVQPLWRRHRSLNSQTTDVLPTLLQERDEVVDSQHDVRDEDVLSHTDIPNSNTQAKHLLQLKLDSGLDICDLGGEVLSVGDWGGELSGLGETWSEKTGDLTDELLGGNEGIVFAGELLDKLLVLVELLQVVDGHGFVAVVLGSVNVVLVSQDAIEAAQKY